MVGDLNLVFVLTFFFPPSFSLHQPQDPHTKLEKEFETKTKQRTRSETKGGSVGGWGRERKLEGRQETVLITMVRMATE